MREASWGLRAPAPRGKGAGALAAGRGGVAPDLITELISSIIPDLDASGQPKQVVGLEVIRWVAFIERDDLWG